MAVHTSTRKHLGSSLQIRKPIRGSLVWWLRFLGVIAFIAILMRLPGPKEVHPVHIDLRWIGFCMLLTILHLLLEAFVWYRLIAAQRIRYPYPKTLLTYLSSQYLGLVTPGHVGEFLAAGYISMDTGITFGYALSSVVMKKILGWLTILGFGIWGLPLLAEVPYLQGLKEVIGMGVVILLILAMGIGIWVVSIKRLTRKWEKLSPWQIEMPEFWSGMRHLRSAQLLVPLALAALAFSILFFQLEAILRALGIGLSFVLVAKMMALSRIAARLIPISAVGFGSKDAAIIWLLMQQQVPLAVGVTVALLLLMCSYLVTLLLSGLCWWIRPLVIRRSAPSG